MWVALCRVVSRRCTFPFPSRRRVAVPFRLYFGSAFCLFRESLTSLCVHCPSQEFGGLRQLPLPETSRRLTRLFHTWFGYWPNLTCRSVWEDVHISSIGSKFSSTHPFSILLLTHVILPRLWRQRNGVRKLERSILKPSQSAI